MAGIRVGLGASCFSGCAGKFKILLWPGLGWTGAGKGREAVYTSQDEPAMIKVLRRWPRE